MGSLARQLAFAQMPSTFYTALQVSAPRAIQAWSDGWFRVAGWLFATSCFGLWAIAQQHLVGHADTLEPSPVRAPRMWRALRGVAAVAGALTAGALAAEGFVRILSAVFQCPGCGG